MKYKPEVIKDLKKGKYKIPVYIMFLIIVLGINWSFPVRMILINLYAVSNTYFFSDQEFTLKNVVKNVVFINIFILSIIGINHYINNALLSTIIIHLLGIGLILYANRDFLKKSWLDVKNSLDPIKEARKRKKESELQKV